MLTKKRKGLMIAGIILIIAVIIFLIYLLESKNPKSVLYNANEIKREKLGYSVTYSVPKDFTYSNETSNDEIKHYKFKGDNYSQIFVDVLLVNLPYSSYDGQLSGLYDIYNNDSSYSNVVLSEIESIKVGDKEFKYRKLTVNHYNYIEEWVNIWYKIEDEIIFTIELQSPSKDVEITEDIMKGFLDIEVKKIN